MTTPAAVTAPADALATATVTATTATTTASPTLADAPQALMGFGHFLAQSDAVGKTLLAILVLMSAASWAIILTKGLSQWLRGRRSEQFLSFFWNARSLDDVQAEVQTHGARDPFGHLAAHAIHAQAHHARYGAAKLQEAGSAQDFVTRTIKKVLDEETTRLENGLTLLATIGATAPFFGLFGTVWGVYHALLAIGGSGGVDGSGSLDQVAGPVGEALIMTGIGLAVAIPAVMAYNAFTRHNRVLGGRLDAFAFELQTFLSTGATLGTGQGQGSVTPLTPVAPAPASADGAAVRPLRGAAA